MMEHSAFGFRETDFVVRLDGEPACLGTIVKGLRPVERPGLGRVGGRMAGRRRKKG